MALASPPRAPPGRAVSGGTIAEAPLVQRLAAKASQRGDDVSYAQHAN